VATGGQGKSKVPVSSIIGGALGALALILIFLLALLWIRRRPRKDHSSEKKGTPPPPGLYTQLHPSINPFDISRPPHPDRKGQPLVGTGMGPAEAGASTASLIMQYSSESPHMPATTSSSSGDITTSSIFGALGSVPSISGGLMSDPPPVYHG